MSKDLLNSYIIVHAEFNCDFDLILRIFLHS